MRVDDVSFVGTKSSTGYWWDDDWDEPLLRPATDDWDYIVVRTRGVSPLLQFVRVEEPEDVIAFANCFGAITGGMEEEPEQAHETIDDWRDLARWLRIAIAGLASIQGNTAQPISRVADELIEEIEEGQGASGIWYTYPSYSGGLSPPDDFHKLAPRDLIQDYVSQIATEASYLGTAFEVYFEPSKVLSGGYRHTALPSYLWALVAAMYIEDVPVGVCEQCNCPFIVKRNTRLKKRFCDGTCRQRFNRARQDQAKQMRADGAHLRTIAKHFDVDTSTVKKWVGED